MTEAAIIGFSGGAFGVAAGSLLGYRDVDTSLRAGLGLTVLYSYPAAAAIFAFFAAVALTVAAGWAPARKASGVKITAALGYE